MEFRPPGWIQLLLNNFHQIHRQVKGRAHPNRDKKIIDTQPSGDSPSAEIVSGPREVRLRNAYAHSRPKNSLLATATRRSPSSKQDYPSSVGESERGEVYAELERACDELDRTLEQLKKAGYTFREFAKVLETDPTGILMTHSPTGYMIYPDEINKTPWEYNALRPIIDLDYIIELLKRARELRRAKIDMEHRLGKKIVPLAPSP